MTPLLFPSFFHQNSNFIFLFRAALSGILQNSAKRSVPFLEASPLLTVRTPVAPLRTPVTPVCTPVAPLCICHPCFYPCHFVPVSPNPSDQASSPAKRPRVDWGRAALAPLSCLLSLSLFYIFTVSAPSLYITYFLSLILFSLYYGFLINLPLCSSLCSSFCSFFCSSL